MRDRVMGMRRTDIAILEHLFNEGRELIETPSDIAANTGFTAGNVRHRMPVLRRAGLVQYHDESKGQYKSTISAGATSLASWPPMRSMNSKQSCPLTEFITAV